MSTLAETLARGTREGELYESLPDGRLRCVACGHRCPILDGTRWRLQGPLQPTAASCCVPWGYVGGAAVRSDREEAVLPRPARARWRYSFGMLGCDLHCAYCQNWVTSQALRDPTCRCAAASSHRRGSWCATRCGHGARVVVSTYNEPLITSEWAVAVFKRRKAAGLADRLRLQRQRHAGGARVPAAVDRSLQSRSEELRRSPLSRTRRTARADPRHHPPAARDGRLAGDRHAAHSRASTTATTSCAS